MTDDQSFPSPDDRVAASLSEQVARIMHEEMELIRDELRNELRERTRRRRRTAQLYAGSAAAGLYGGGALVAFLVLVLGLTMPAWAAALIVGAVLIAVAVVLRQAAKPGRGHGHGGHEDSGLGGTAPATVPTVPPMPQARPTIPGTGVDSTRAPHHRAR